MFFFKTLMGGNSTNIFPSCCKFLTIFFWYQKILKEKNHPFTTTFFYLHTRINSTLL
jgi:hypothetical protein